MNYQKKAIVKQIFSLIVSILIFLLALALVISSLKHGDGVLIFCTMLAIGALAVWSSSTRLIDAVSDYKATVNSDVLSSLASINTYTSYADMQTAFEIQKNSRIYEDEKIIITNDFLAFQNGRKLFIVDGILDIKTLVSKVNGVIDYVSIIFIYYDGKKYEIKYRRPLGISNMRKKVSEVEYAANIIANIAKNFRKYPSCRF